MSAKQDVKVEVANVTRVAAIILVEGAAAIHKRKLSNDELKLIGRALGWMVYATHGTPNDILKQLDKAIADELPAASKLADSAPGVEIGDPTALEVSGGRRKKMRGGAPPMVILILGAIGSIFGINTVGNIYHTAAHRDVVREASMRQIAAACPADLALGPPPKPFVDWKGEYAAALSQYETTNAQCEAAKNVGKARVDAAEAALSNAWKRVPAQAGTLATAASLVMAGTVTGPAVAAAFTLGKSVHTIATSFVEGSVPSGGAEFNDFVSLIADGFPVPTPTPSPTATAAAAPAVAAGEGAPAGDGGVPAAAPSAPAAAPPPPPASRSKAQAPAAAPAAPAASAAAQAPVIPTWPKPPMGGRRRKTQKRKAKRRVTRRVAAVKFVY